MHQYPDAGLLQAIPSEGGGSGHCPRHDHVSSGEMQSQSASK
jgi:hypothetical protein